MKALLNNTFLQAVVFQLLLCFCFAGAMVGQFDLSPLMICYHFFVIGIALLFVFIVGSASVLLSRKVAAPLLCIPALLLALLFLFLSFFYGAFFVGHYFWGGGLTASVFMEFVGDYETNSSLLLPVLLVYGFFSAVILLLYGFFASRIGSANWELLQMLGLLNSKVRAGLFFGLLTLVLAGFICLAHQSRVLAGLIVKHEPIASFFNPVSVRFPGASFGVEKHQANIAARTTYPKQDPKRAKSIVLITIDALRADNMSIYGYERKTSPFLDSLEQEGKLFRVKNVFSTCAQSFCGLLSIQASCESNDIAMTSFKLQDLLDDNDYITQFYLSGNHQSWYRLGEHYNYGKSIDFFIDSMSKRKYSANDDRNVLAAFSDQVDNLSHPYFLNFHLMSAHLLGPVQQQFRKFSPNEIGSGVSPDSIAYRNNFNNGIIQSDFVVSEIFRMLEERDLLEETIVVITADHGEELGERNYYGHSNHLYQESIAIPLLIYDADLSGYKNREVARQIDIAPTLIDRMNWMVPAIWKGQSLLEQQSPTYSIHRQDEWFAVVYSAKGELWKYIYNNKTSQSELFNLYTDPKEKNNRIHEVSPAFRKSLEAELLNRCPVLKDVVFSNSKK